MSLPKISIVTPSYNQGEFLEECIDSVLCQNYPALEYVIMDGGSTDNSVDIIKKYEKYLHFWQSRADGGQYNAINEGFKKTSGQIMAWLNSDDKYHDRALFLVSYIFSIYQNIEWITGRPTFWDKQGQLIRIMSYLPVYCRADFLNKKYNDPFIQQESTFWRRSLWDQAGGHVRADLGYAGDLELWVRFFRLTELHSVDALIAGYRSHGNQKAALAMDKYITEALKILEQELLLVNSSNSPRILPAPEPLKVSPSGLNGFLQVSCPVSNRMQCSTHQLFEYFLKFQNLAPSRDDLLQRLQQAETTLAMIESSRTWLYTRPLRDFLATAKKTWKSLKGF